MIYIDTHVFIWLYSGLQELLSDRVKSLIDQNELLISPMAVLETEYLYETGKISLSSNKILEDLESRVGLKLCNYPFEKILKSALKQDWTRDPFDRLIVAQAASKDLKLISKDKIILKHYSKAVW